MLAALAFFVFSAIDFLFYGQVSDCVNRGHCDTMREAQIRKPFRNSTQKADRNPLWRLRPQRHRTF